AAPMSVSRHNRVATCSVYAWRKRLLRCTTLPTWSRKALARSAWPWPSALTAMPARKSRYSRPVLSSSTAPWPATNTSPPPAHVCIKPSSMARLRFGGAFGDEPRAGVGAQRREHGVGVVRGRDLDPRSRIRAQRVQRGVELRQHAALGDA